VAAPAGVTAVLRAVSADSAGDVWTAGDNQGHPVVLRYNGRAWAPVAVPLAGYSDLLQGVKAVSPSDVWAAGLEVVNDTTFQVATLNGVAAASGGSVIAVGSYDDPGTAGPVRRTLVLRWTGSSWTTVPSRNAGPTDNALHAAAAVPRSTIVWAAGFRYTPAQLSQTLILKGS
jgi:hypothetical protein